MIFIIGGVRSGKSTLAENIIKNYDNKIYLATLVINDPEMEKRKELHLKNRESDNYVTYEVPFDIKDIKISKENVILLDCLTNLVANEIFLNNSLDVINKVTNEIKKIKDNSKELVIVSNDVFKGYNNYSKETNEFLYNLGQIHINVANMAESVYKIEYGIKTKLK